MPLLKLFSVTSYNTLDKVSILLLSLFAFTLPLYQKISTVVLVLLVLFSVIKFFIDKAYMPVLAYLFPVLLYVLILVSIFVTQNFEIRYLEQRSALIGLPLIFLTLKISQETLKKILEYFIYGCLLALVICYINAFNNSFQYVDGHWLFQPVVNKQYSFLYAVVREGNYFFSDLFSVLHDSTNMSIYFNFAIATILAFSLWKKSKVYYILLFVLTLAVFQLSSKISIMVMFIIYSGYLFYRIKKQSLKLVIVCITLVLGSVFLFQNPRGRIMIQKFKVEGTTFNPNERMGYALRFMSWGASVELIKEHPILGVGINNAQKELNNKYESKGYTTPLSESLNAQNQYLQAYLETGVLGVLLIFVMQFALLKIAWLNQFKSNAFLIVMFLLIVSSCFLFEGMFNRYSGLAFFMFVYCLVINNKAQQICNQPD
jgi:O-antigen ligase